MSMNTMTSGLFAELDHDDWHDPWAGMTIAEMKAEDDYDEHVIEEVNRNGDHTSITSEDGMGLGWNRERVGDEIYDSVVPQKGSILRVYGSGLGYRFHGIDLDGQELFWETPMERDAERVRWMADDDRSHREEFAEEKPKLDKDFENLPAPLKARITRFREADPAFRVTSEAYELFACTEGAKFWRAALEAERGDYNHDEVERFWADPEIREKEYGSDIKGTVYEEDPGPENYAQRWLIWVWSRETDRQKELIDYDTGHSGNTFGGAMWLALALLRGDEV
jgi:hypothetical protein